MMYSGLCEYDKSDNIKPGVLKLLWIATLSKYYQNYATLDFVLFLGCTQTSPWPRGPSLPISVALEKAELVIME
jgi:hypothetical protein